MHNLDVFEGIAAGPGDINSPLLIIIIILKEDNNNTKRRQLQQAQYHLGTR